MNEIDFHNDYTVIDIETTGLNSTLDNIIELSAIKVRNNQIVSTFSKLINPNKKLNPFISNLTGITDSMLKQADTISKVLPQFLDFVGKDIILGHNVQFDIKFINQKSIEHLNKPFENEKIDTLRISRKLKIKSGNHKLKTLADFYNISQGRMHRGLEDCRITFEVYKHLKENSIEKIKEIV